MNCQRRRVVQWCGVTDWAVDSASGPQYVAVLGEPPADFPLAAVRVWLVS